MGHTMYIVFGMKLVRNRTAKSWSLQLVEITFMIYDHLASNGVADIQLHALRWVAMGTETRRQGEERAKWICKGNPQRWTYSLLRWRSKSGAETPLISFDLLSSNFYPLFWAQCRPRSSGFQRSDASLPQDPSRCLKMSQAIAISFALHSSTILS